MDEYKWCYENDAVVNYIQHVKALGHLVQMHLGNPSGSEMFSIVPSRWLHVYPESHSFLDISIHHSGVSRGHRNVPNTLG